ncbi:DUF2339 domain-containing protein [Salinimonas chungwhensis]|uniref:DUF2339 domain-containing protein n=1 Tax=Salinimonas chungwhensis TaxID=265425 RepID=UPI00039CDF6C|nr:DUF2339 domain-containing protein [Salinimonas chungwhensis]
MEGIAIFIGIVVAALLFRLHRRVKILEQRLDAQAALLIQSPPIGQSPPLAHSETDSISPAASPPVQQTRRVPAKGNRATSKLTDVLIGQLKANGLLWLGGITLSLGGVFLALYAIEAGILSPAVRLAMGGAFGSALILLAEFLTRHQQRFNIQTSYVAAAIASGGIICCYAITMVTYSVFALIGDTITFTLLALLSLISTWLTLRYGWLLAVVGVSGAYLVPILVPTEHSSQLLFTAYLLLVSASAVYIGQRTGKLTIAMGALVAHTGLSLLALFSTADADALAVLLNSSGMLYLFSLTSFSGWRLLQLASGKNSASTSLYWSPSLFALTGALAALILTLTAIATGNTSIPVMVVSSGFAVSLLMVGAKTAKFDSLMVMALITVCAALLALSNQSASSNDYEFASQPAVFMQIAALLLSAYGALFARYHPGRVMFHVLYVITAPLLSVLLISSEGRGEPGHTYWLTVELTVYAFIAAVALTRCTRPLTQLATTLMLHFCLVVIVVMHLSGSLLSMAVALQVAALTWQSQKLQISVPQWLYKMVITVLIVRLSWLLWQPLEGNDALLSSFGSLPTFALVLIALGGCYRMLKHDGVSRWFAGALMHITTLFVTSASLWLLTGDTFIQQIDYPAAALLACNWILLAAVYSWRAALSQSLSKLYRVFALTMLVAALGLHTWLSLADNPYLTRYLFTPTSPLIWLTILWGLPGFAALWFTAYWRGGKTLKPALRIIGGLFIAMWLNGLIRTLFHENGIGFMRGFTQPELYTYSLIWLITATGLLFVGLRKNQSSVRRAGFGLLLVVVCKVFLVDMSHLTGLWRAISFIGLGGSLVLLGWLFQRFNQPDRSDSSE